MKNNNRLSQSLAPIIHFDEQKNFTYPYQILSAPTDTGVIRNFGKNGARFAPTAIINHLKKLNNHLELSNNNAIKVTQVTDTQTENEDFEKAQNKQSDIIFKILDKKLEKLIHIGGGHDHVFPLLKALDKIEDYKNILIINIDAHCDTRVDKDNHSGTPFRDFDDLSKKPFHIIQYGIQDFSNSKTTLTPLRNGTEKKFFIEDIMNETSNFKLIPEDLLKDAPFKINENTAILFSLDCDGIDGSQMQAVSCVNPLGLPVHHIQDLLHYFKTQFHSVFFGLYEFNPVYDHINQYSCKVITQLIYQYLKKA